MEEAPIRVEKVPATQPMQVLIEIAPSTEDHDPRPQLVQLGAPSADHVPETQVLQVVGEGAPLAALNVPALQLEQAVAPA